MPLYQIKRDVGHLSQEDMDAAALRAIVCAPQFPGLRWIRSYWDRERGSVDCVYEATSPQQLQEHAATARIPCDDVRPVEELVPDSYTHA
ncbi:MAG TPA: DUF4242 domain-containing protein [Tepidiformaceae bacterium]|nr:DUF4242 domain-containing protein [Tepidiformaceae bacterium]HMO95832.1 DUF4242 domain-containing protein [Tepidiformaceae bacterium]